MTRMPSQHGQSRENSSPDARSEARARADSDRHDAAPNPFAHLGLPVRFTLDQGAIDRAYLARAARQHPDQAGADAFDAAGFSADPSEADDRMAALNRARHTLADDERRARAVLALAGASAGDRDLPPGFLMQMMELREQIEAEFAAAAACEDRAETARVRARWEAWARDRRAGHAADIAPILDRVGAAIDAGRAPDPDDVSEAGRVLNAWRYAERLLEQLDPAYDAARADFSD